MCGIAGYLHRMAPDDLERRLANAAQSLQHRGPDAQRVWLDREAGIGLAHARLKILDLTESGAQPMQSADGRFRIVYNGEVYNHGEIRSRLLAERGGFRFRGSSDTETIVESFAQWGVKRAVQEFIGMFALAAWDRERRELILVRDRIGIKPLYWGEIGGALLFGSELKAFEALWSSRPALDPVALGGYMRSGCVPGSLSIYEGVQKLPPATILRLRIGMEPLAEKYWRLDEVAAGGLSRRGTMAPAEHLDELERLLRDAVRQCLLSDVPLGAFLSGGIDSSTVVAMMQAESSRPVRTFSVGFAESQHNEAPHAARIARYLGTDHTEMTVTAGEAMEAVPLLADIYDEPFADSSQLPTFLIARLSRRHVTVALSGDGGDEVFAGYNRHVLARRAVPALLALPLPLRRMLRRGMERVPFTFWDSASARLPARLRVPQAGDKWHKLASIMDARLDQVHATLASHWTGQEVLLRRNGAPSPRVPQGFEQAHSLLDQIQFLDTVTYLPDDILTKVDRATMAVSLECRVPLLDHRLVEAAWALPPNMKIRGMTGKVALRRILERYIPRAMVRRPKSGFAVPLGSWLRGPLQDWAENLLDPVKLRQAGYLDATVVRAAWEEHQRGRRNRHHDLWNVLMFQAWYERRFS